MIDQIFSIFFHKKLEKIITISKSFINIYVPDTLSLEFFTSQCKSIRKLTRKTGLLFAPQIDFEELLERGNEYASVNGITETPMIVGRFIVSLESGVYDGLINLSTFNCQPVMNAQPIIRLIANKSNIPYAALDCEGPWISTNQRRLLETIAVQAKRVRREKNKLKYKS